MGIKELCKKITINGQDVVVADTSILVVLDRLEALEKERDSYKVAYNEWITKTEWVQDELTRGKLPVKYLGMHRADVIKVEIDTLRAELETERMRLTACGVVALANTPDSAKQARDMRSEYWSASCEDVVHMVDQNIELRAKVAEMEKQEPVGTTGGMPGTTGFTMACFHADKVPIGTKLYTLPGAKGEDK